MLDKNQKVLQLDLVNHKIFMDLYELVHFSLILSQNWHMHRMKD